MSGVQAVKSGEVRIQGPFIRIFLKNWLQS